PLATPIHAPDSTGDRPVGLLSASLPERLGAIGKAEHVLFTRLLHAGSGQGIHRLPRLTGARPSRLLARRRGAAAVVDGGSARTGGLSCSVALASVRAVPRADRSPRRRDHWSTALLAPGAAIGGLPARRRGAAAVVDVEGDLVGGGRLADLIEDEGQSLLDAVVGQVDTAGGAVEPEGAAA